MQASNNGGEVIGIIAVIMLVLYGVSQLLAAINWWHVALACGGGLVTLIAGATLIYFLVTDPRTTLKWLTAIVWIPHLWAAQFIVGIARHPIICRWAIREDEKRTALLIWLRYLPFDIAALWAFTSTLWLMTRMPWPWWLAIPISLGSTALWVYFYYTTYFNAQPDRQDWVPFVSEYHEWKLEHRLRRIEKKAGIA